MNLLRLGTFVGGVVFGTAGVGILSSEDAKKAYTQCTAAVLRGRDSVMKTVAIVKENCGDIYEDAMDINENRANEAEIARVEAARAIIEAYEEKAADAK